MNEMTFLSEMHGHIVILCFMPKNTQFLTTNPDFVHEILKINAMFGNMGVLC